jgi:hypothetical protein
VWARSRIQLRDRRVGGRRAARRISFSRIGRRGWAVGGGGAAAAAAVLFHQIRFGAQDGPMALVPPARSSSASEAVCFNAAGSPAARTH